MINIKRWILYTVIIGALPMIIRLLCYWLLDSPVGFAFNPIDIIFFGLTLNLSNINELNGVKLKKQKNNKLCQEVDKDKIFLGMSILLIIFLALTLGIVYASELSNLKFINTKSVFIGTIFLSVASLVFSYIVILKIQHYYDSF